jgi:hypothetical protein
MEVSIIIINYNTFELTSACIRSVIEFTKDVSYEIILVDNASTECDPEKFLDEFPSVKLIKSDINGGFAFGNNLGIKEVEGMYILLLNSDTLLFEDSITKSISYIGQHPGAGVLGCRVIFPNKKIQYTARKFKSIKWELLDLFRFIPMLMSYQKRSRLMLGKYFRCDENISPDWINGAFFLFRKDILEKLPGKKLDDRFFMYGEDQLWCEQIKKLGYQVLFFSETTIVHLGNASTDKRRQLALRRLMLKHELAIMRFRKGEGLYYYSFAATYGLKEYLRYLLKMLTVKSSSKR